MGSRLYISGMKNVLKLGIVLLLFSSCNKEQKIYSEKDIEGVWIDSDSLITAGGIPYYGGGMPYGNLPLILENKIGDQVDSIFKIKGDTIWMRQVSSLFKNFENINDAEKEWHPVYSIVQQNQDTLSLVILGLKKTKKYFRLKENQTNSSLTEFGFSSHGCFGSCPIFDIDIKKDSVFYWTSGLSRLPQNRPLFYKAKTDTSFWNYFNSLYNSFDIRSEDSSKRYANEDEWNYDYFFISGKDTTSFCCARKADNPALGTLIYEMAVYFNAVKTDTISFNHRFPFGHPPPPPPFIPPPTLIHIDFVTPPEDILIDNFDTMMTQDSVK
jgi:hypothetical protein